MTFEQELIQNTEWEHANPELWEFLCKVHAGFNTSGKLCRLVWKTYANNHSIDWDATYNNAVDLGLSMNSIVDFTKCIGYSGFSETNRIPTNEYEELKRGFKDLERFKAFVHANLSTGFNVAFQIPHYGLVYLNDSKLNFKGILRYWNEKGVKEAEDALKYFS